MWEILIGRFGDAPGVGLTEYVLVLNRSAAHRHGMDESTTGYRVNPC